MGDTGRQLLGAATIVGAIVAQQYWSVGWGLAILGGGTVVQALLAEDIEVASLDQAAAGGGAGLRVNTCSTQEPIRVVYGQLRVGGNDVYRGSSGKNKWFLWIVQTLGEGPCEGLHQVDGKDQAFLGDLLYDEYGGLKSLRSSKYKWTASGQGTNEYYCEDADGGDSHLKNEPNGIRIDGDLATKGTLGSLSAGQWGFGNNDGLEFKTVYVRLSDGTDPDTKSSGYIKTAENALFWFHAGTSSQTVDPNLNAAIPEWTDTLRYTAHIIWKLRYDPDYFQSFPNRTVVFKGRKLYDFRDESTAYSNNPVLCLYDFMTSTRYGRGVASSKFDITSWTSTANYCDTKGWTLNMAVMRDDPAIDVIRTMLGHFRGELVWYDGKWYLRYADLNYESSVMTLEDKHIARDESGKAIISVTQQSRFKKPDGLSVTFIDPDRDYIADSFPVGNEEGVIKELKLLGCTDRQQAADLGVYELEREKLDRVITGLFRDDAVKLEKHDPVTLNSSALSISSQLMRVKEANIQPDGLIDLVLIYEALALYDDDYNLDEEGVYTCTFPNPTDEPPSVQNVQHWEEQYDFRLHATTRFKVSFDAPDDYAWYDHVEVWLSFNDADWEHIFNSNTDFQIDPVEEGATYYIRLKVVSIWGTKQDDANDYKISRTILGYDPVPASLPALYAIVNANCINLYAEKVSDPDIELYEFRLGTSWSGAIFLAALRSPNLSLYGVKPGNHTFMANTLSNNALYGSTPRSAAVALKDPPDGWTVQNTESIDTLIVNGTMEADANWSDSGTPTVNERSSEQKHAGSYSRKFTSDLAGDGIRGDAFTTANSGKYGCTLWVYPLDATKVKVVVRTGDASTNSYNHESTGLTQDAWNEIFFTFEEGATTGGTSANIRIFDGSGDTGTWYVDDVCLMQGEYDNAAPILYSDEAQIKCRHSGSLTGSYSSPIFDRGSSVRYMAYVLAAISIIGAGTTWDDIVPDPDTWEDINISTRTWAEICELDAGPAVRIKLKYADSSPPTSEVEKLEILSAIATGRYFQPVITITDPSAAVNALVEHFTLKFCQ